MRLVRAGAAWAIALSVGCGDQRARPRPVEVPIAEYRVDDVASPVVAPSDSGSPSPNSGTGTGTGTGTGISVIGGGDREADDAKAVDTKAGVATQLDVKGGFLGATFGSTPKAYRGLVGLDKRGETFRAPTKSYGGFALRDVLFAFRKGKLGTIQFAMKSNDDCKPVRESLVRDLGGPQRVSGDTSTWRGDKIALRFVISSSGACNATVVSKEFAKMEFDAL